MSSRFHLYLLSVALLLILNACGTTGSAPGVDSSAERDLSLPTQAIDSTVEDQQDKIYAVPSDRSLAEVAELTNNISTYQPEQALEILRSLESVPSGQLVAMIESQIYDPEFTEWLELALQVRTLVINGSPVNAAAQKWANYHYGHVVTRADFPALVSSYKALFPVPAQVAVLLPAEGGLAAAAKAIRDGILSAYFEHPGDSAIRFYSSGENSESAIAAYLQASQDGATQIVGPLRLESTRALAGLHDLSVPVLLLNQTGGNTPTGPDQTTAVNSLSLSQTEEAAAIATRAMAQEQKRAIVIVPDSNWGTRIGRAFTGAFEQRGGYVAAITYFDSTTSDHSAVLTRLLKIDESTQRKTDLQSRLRIPLNFEPTRRADFDFIFLAANPAEGRELKPLLRFHDTGDIPVYAMGRIFSGRAARASDQDLNGVIFPATPWQIQAISGDSLTPDSIRGGAFGNLYALGQDAWHLLAWLPLMQKDTDLWFPGDVGALRLQANGHLYRQPAWAQFSGGRPIPYQWPDLH